MTHTGGMNMYRHILLAYDGSEHAKRAARKAAEIAGQFKATVTVVTAYPKSPSHILGAEPITAEEMEAYWEEKAAETADLFLNYGTSFSKVVRAEDPKSLILDTAEELDVDLIILGSRGLSNYARLMLGGVSQAITQHAGCDVLVVK
ncbi:universal stress family protein [Aneurinibacillus aneurinilyticus ATCC 12856]|uniref:Universal stress protein n=2 Tax=Aneurinibacillus aneurinilyticus TaxID=1391 RepID=U1X1S5_ANEAE|nr:universal stress family protein [Aneurinibacillus aneurinilyticus ATCC 12856]